MRRKGLRRVGFIGACVALCALPAVAQYPDGFVWSRQADWVVMPEVNNGKTNGNPVADAQGNPVWNHQYVTGTNGLNQPVETARWYAQTPTQLQWRAYTIPGWSGTLDWNYRPYLTSNALVFAYRTDFFMRTPLLRWINPVTREAKVLVGGPFTLSLPNGSQPGSISDVVIGKVTHAQGDAITVVWSRTYIKPSNWDPWTTNDTVTAQAVRVAPGDQIFWSARKRGSYGSDHSLTFAERLTLGLQYPAGTVISLR